MLDFDFKSMDVLICKRGSNTVVIIAVEHDGKLNFVKDSLNLGTVSDINKEYEIKEIYRPVVKHNEDEDFYKSCIFLVIRDGFDVDVNNSSCFEKVYSQQKSIKKHKLGDNVHVNWGLSPYRFIECFYSVEGEIVGVFDLGYAVDVGIDKNRNHVLNFRENEITSSQTEQSVDCSEDDIWDNYE